MYSDTHYEKDYPQWRDDRLYNIEFPFPKKRVKKLMIRSGINIAAFTKFKNLESETLMDSLTRLKKYILVSFEKMKKIRMSNNVK